jgi:hypothetical protein
MCGSPNEVEYDMSVALVKEMFDRMLVAKDPDAISRYYAPDFVMITNGVTQQYEAFATSHEGISVGSETYAIEYDEQAWVESAGRVAGRMRITVRNPDETASHIEVMLIAVIVDDRIRRVWETYVTDASRSDGFTPAE